MTPNRPMLRALPGGSIARLGRRSTGESLRALQRRLECVEHELHVQFTRIAQLQAEIDCVVAPLRRAHLGALGRR